MARTAQPTNGLRITQASGADLLPYLDDVARLRIRVFREYPYLYDGTEDYERRYLHTYMNAPDAMAVLAWHGEQIVGVSTSVPMARETPAFKQPLQAQGYDVARVFYCGESVLLPEWRGQGIYKQFFQGREDYARALGGMEWMVFCAVQRPINHPLRPSDYQGLEAVWQRFGYSPQAALVTSFDWKEVDQPAATAHPMGYWVKRLSEQG